LRAASLHYWWFASRDFDHGNAATDAFLLEASDKAYREDKDALEWIMDVVRHDSEPHLDLNFAPDKPGLLMRRVMHDLAAREAGHPV
jgi:vanillate O-demethylase monooxygenase subunit